MILRSQFTSETDPFPGEEIYGLTAQLRRASYSVLANIVEGASRESKRDYLHFLYIARGSLSETQYFVHLAYRLRYLSPTEADALRQQTKCNLRVPSRPHPSREERDRKTDGGKAKFTVIS